MKQDIHENVAEEMAELSLRRLDEAKSIPALIPGKSAGGGELIESAKRFVRRNLIWLMGPDGRAQRIALGMFLAVGLALLSDGGGPNPDGQWKTGGGY